MEEERVMKRLENGENYFYGSLRRWNTYFKFTIKEGRPWIPSAHHATFAMKRFILIVIFDDIAILTMDHSSIHFERTIRLWCDICTQQITFSLFFLPRTLHPSSFSPLLPIDEQTRFSSITITWLKYVLALLCYKAHAHTLSFSVSLFWLSLDMDFTYNKIATDPKVYYSRSNLMCFFINSIVELLVWGKKKEQQTADEKTIYSVERFLDSISFTYS